MMGIVGTYFTNGFIKVRLQTFKNRKHPLRYHTIYIFNTYINIASSQTKKCNKNNVNLTLKVSR